MSFGGGGGGGGGGETVVQFIDSQEGSVEIIYFV